MNKGRLFVFSAPSGAGKSTILGRLSKLFPNSVYSISHTTRSPRKGEVDGKDYFFVSKERFLQMVEEGKFLEWEEILGNLYGTSREFIEEALNRNQDVFMDIDVKGAQNIKNKFPKAILVFIKPPSLEELKRRLEKRGTEPEEVIRKRLSLAEEELKEADRFDYVVINEDLDQAINEIAGIILKERGKDGDQ